MLRYPHVAESCQRLHMALPFNGGDERRERREPLSYWKGDSLFDNEDETFLAFGVSNDVRTLHHR